MGVCIHLEPTASSVTAKGHATESDSCCSSISYQKPVIEIFVGLSGVCYSSRLMLKVANNNGYIKLCTKSNIKEKQIKISLGNVYVVAFDIIQLKLNHLTLIFTCSLKIHPFSSSSQTYGYPFLHL